MRGRSLHRRLLQARQSAGFVDGTVHHNGVAVLPSIDEPRHSRQNSRDSNRSIETARRPQQPQQSVVAQPASNTHSPGSVGKNIEIYATLPKKKGKKAAEMLLQQQQQQESSSSVESQQQGRQSRCATIQQRGSASSTSSGGYPTSIGRRERAKSEERNKSSSRHPIAGTGVQQPAQQFEEDPSSDSSKSAGKKQHRIRRRLLMGGLIKRKNRSLPDLRADEDESVNSLDTDPADAEDFQPPVAIEDASNASLEKSKLMRKSFVAAHSASLNRPPPPHAMLQQSPQNKVPPPPPIRKTSHLMTPQESQQITVRADIHHERSNSDLPYSVAKYEPPSVDPLPPYPQVEHVRQASDDFPPPPPPQELQWLDCDPGPLPPPPTDEEVSDVPDGPTVTTAPTVTAATTGLLAELQRKRKEILGAPVVTPAVAMTTAVPSIASASSGSNPWLEELQSTFKAKKMLPILPSTAGGPSTAQQMSAESEDTKSVRKLASRFEQVRISPNTSADVVDHAPVRIAPQQEPIQPQPVYQAPPAPKPAGPVSILDRKRRSNEGGGKKKSVTFCDQVILVSTAEDTEQDETYVPNPILQRVLRSAYQSGMDQKQPEQQQQQQQPLQLQQHHQQLPPIQSAPLVAPNFGVNASGADEVDRMTTNTMRPPPYQRLPVNSQVYQQQQQQQQPPPPPQQQQHPINVNNNSMRYVPSSPMMGQRTGPPPSMGAPPSYAPPPQYSQHARGRLPPQQGGRPPVYNPPPMVGSQLPPVQHQPQWQPPSQPPYSMAPCSLCGKKQVPSSHQYCSDCQFYMQRFQPKV